MVSALVTYGTQSNLHGHAHHGVGHDSYPRYFSNQGNFQVWAFMVVSFSTGKKINTINTSVIPAMPTRFTFQNASKENIKSNNASNDNQDPPQISTENLEIEQEIQEYKSQQQQWRSITSESLQERNWDHKNTPIKAQIEVPEANGYVKERSTNYSIETRRGTDFACRFSFSYIREVKNYHFNIPPYICPRISHMNKESIEMLLPILTLI